MPRPPMALLERCIEPDEPVEVLVLLRKGRVDDAAAAYAKYVLDVRDAFQVCNGRLSSLRGWLLDE